MQARIITLARHVPLYGIPYRGTSPFGGDTVRWNDRMLGRTFFAVSAVYLFNKSFGTPAGFLLRIAMMNPKPR